MILRNLNICYIAIFVNIIKMEMILIRHITFCFIEYYNQLDGGERRGREVGEGGGWSEEAKRRGEEIL